MWFGKTQQALQFIDTRTNILRSKCVSKENGAAAIRFLPISGDMPQCDVYHGINELPRLYLRPPIEGMVPS